MCAYDTGRKIDYTVRLHSAKRFNRDADYLLVKLKSVGSDTTMKPLIQFLNKLGR